MKRAAARVVAVLAALSALGYLLLLGALYVGQESLIFPGTPLPADHRFAFDQPFEEIRVPVAGATLDALLFRQSAPRGLVFYLHGNRGNVETWTTGLDFYRRVNYDLFIFDYRGYGRSTGRNQDERQLDADVRAAWDAIAPRYRDKPIVIYGRSLGTGLAVRLARDVAPRLLVLVAPYTSLVAAGQRAYPFVPAFLFKYPLRSDEAIAEVKSPVLLMHGTRDRLIPPSDSEALRALVRSSAELVLIEDAGHSDIHRFPTYLDALAERLARIAGG
ncbi:MAG TPA: alpha/beta fold hydrolase [Casimicrobiaceae bacterium]|nr:alpha/beta fold hydrolase [Casimicrobiaceae bacterium]